jgi:hypothetical protein
MIGVDLGHGKPPENSRVIGFATRDHPRKTFLRDSVRGRETVGPVASAEGSPHLCPSNLTRLTSHRGGRLGAGVRGRRRAGGKMGVGPLNFLVHLSKSMSGPGRYAGPWILGRPSKTHRKHPCRVAGRLGKGARLSSLVAAKRLGQLAGDVVEGAGRTAPFTHTDGENPDRGGELGGRTCSSQFCRLSSHTCY